MTQTIWPATSRGAKEKAAPTWVAWKNKALDIFYHNEDGHLMTVDYDNDFFEIDLFRMEVSTKPRANFM